MEIFVDIQQICKQDFEPLFMDTFTPSDMPEADVRNLRYHITQSIVRHFMEESHYEGLVHPRSRSLLEKSEEMGAVLYDHTKISLGGGVELTDPGKQLTARQKENRVCYRNTKKSVNSCVNAEKVFGHSLLCRNFTPNWGLFLESPETFRAYFG